MLGRELMNETLQICDGCESGKAKHILVKDKN